MGDLTSGLVLDHSKNQHGADLRSHEPEARDRWIREVVHRAGVAPDRITVELVHNRAVACVDAPRSPPSPTSAAFTNPIDRSSEPP